MAAFDLASLVSLSEVTRKERTLLLLLTVVLIAVVFGGFRPTKIEQLGIDFTADQIVALIQLLLLITGYLLVAFYLYARDDTVGLLAKLTVARETIMPSSYRNRLTELTALVARGSAEQLSDVVVQLTAVISNVQELIASDIHREARSALYRLEDYSMEIKKGRHDAEYIRDIARFVTAVDQRQLPELKPPLSSWRDIVRANALVYAFMHTEIDAISDIIEQRKLRKSYLVFPPIHQIRLYLLSRHVRRWRRQIKWAKPTSHYMDLEEIVTMRRVWQDLVARTTARNAVFWYGIDHEPVSALLDALAEHKRRVTKRDQGELREVLSREPYVAAIDLALASRPLTLVIRSFAKTLRRFRTRLWFDATLPVAYASIIIIIIATALVASAA